MGAVQPPTLHFQQLSCPICVSQCAQQASLLYSNPFFPIMLTQTTILPTTVDVSGGKGSGIVYSLAEVRNSTSNTSCHGREKHARFADLIFSLGLYGLVALPSLLS